MSNAESINPRGAEFNTLQAVATIENIGSTEISSTESDTAHRSEFVVPSTPTNTSDNSIPPPPPPPPGFSPDDSKREPEHDPEVDISRKLFEEIITLPVPPEFLKLEHDFISAPIQPPITTEFMKELNIESIVNNPRLRRDINFESRIAFRQTEEGGRQKKLQKEKTVYVRGLEADLELIRKVSSLHDSIPRKALACELVSKISRRRLRELLKSINEIMKTMITEDAQQELESHFDIEHQLQEITRGVYDFEGASQRLGRLLMTHCAPIRDPQIDSMVKEISKGDIKSIASGLVSLLEALENMKLDIANHQVRHLKAYFINWTLPFEKKYHESRIKRGKFLPEGSKTWFLEQEQTDLMDGLERPNQPQEFPHLVQGFVGLMLPKDYAVSSAYEALPGTFTEDTNRIQLLRREILDIILLKNCYDVFLGEWQTGFRDRHVAPSIPYSVEVQILGHMRAICAHGGGVIKSIPNLAAGIVKWVGELKGRHSVNQVNSDAIDRIQERLKELLCPDREASHKDTDVKETIERLLKPLTLDVYDVAMENINLDYFEMFKRLVPQPPPTSKSSLVVQNLKPYAKEPKISCIQSEMDMSEIFVNHLAEITKRLAHVAILHWKVWSELVYLKDRADKQVIETEPGPETSSQAFNVKNEGVQSQKNTRVGKSTSQKFEIDRQP